MSAKRAFGKKNADNSKACEPQSSWSHVDRPLCSRCRQRQRVGGKNRNPYCRECHSADMRIWRKTHPLTPEQRRKDSARSYAGVYLRRSKLVREPCGRCGDPNSQMHHPDYDKPLLVQWFCRPCHLQLHREMRCEPALKEAA